MLLSGILLLGVLSSLPQQTAYAISVTPDTSATNLAAAILGGGGGGINLSTVSATLLSNTLDTATSSGTYVNPSSTYGIGSGIIISSGDVNDYNDGPNTDFGRTFGYGVAATAGQEALLDPITGGSFDHFDVTQLDVSFDMLPGFSTVFFNVVFGSEEYDEFVGSAFIDGFGLYVNGVNIATVDGLPVNINHPDMVFAPGTELDGILGGSTGPSGQFVHTFSAPVNPTGNTVTFIVADTSDEVLDTTVYISQLGGSPPIPPEVSIGNVSQLEGDAGTTDFVFTVTRTGDTSGASTVDFDTADGTATTADSDYAANSGTVSFSSGETSKTVTVQVNGDTNVELDETFFVNLSDCVGCTIADGQGLGTILNDDELPPPPPPEGTPGKITGGGAELANGVNFGFNVRSTDGTSFDGNLQYNDKNQNIKLHSTSMTFLEIFADGTSGIFEGTGKVNGQAVTFTIEVQDNGEPGKQDWFSISIPELGYEESGTLAKGNIQVHK